MNKEILTLLQDLSESFFQDSHAKIASSILFLINNKQQLSLKNVANHANVSVSQISKFAQKLGYSKTKDLFLDALSNSSLLEPKQNSSWHFQKQIKDSDIIANYHKMIINNINFAYENNHENLKKLANKMLEQKPRIFLFGKGANLIPIQVLGNYLNKLNFSVAYSTDIDVQFHLVKNVKPDDLVFIFSYSGITNAMQVIADLLDQKTYSVLFTSNIKNSLVEKVDLTLVTKSNEEILIHQRNNYFSFIYLISQLINLLVSK